MSKLGDKDFENYIEEVMKEKSTLEYINKLQQENKQLKERIDKAIEQIEIAQYNLSYNKNCIDKDLQDLLEILGGNNE